MTGGYGTGDGVPGQGGDPTADRPGPLPPRFDPPGGSAPLSGSTVSGSTAGGSGPAWSGTGTSGHASPGTGYPPTSPGASYPGSSGGNYPASSGTSYPAPSSGASYPARATAQPSVGYPGRADTAGASPSAAYSASSGVVTPSAPSQPSFGTVPTQPGPSSFGAAPAQPGQSSYGTPSAQPGQPSFGTASAQSAPAYPGQAPAGSQSFPGQPATSPYADRHSGSGSSYPGRPVSAPVHPGQPVSAPSYPGQPSAYPGQQVSGFGAPLGPPERAPRRSRLAVVALTLAAVLVVVTGVQAYQIYRLDDRLAAADKRMAEGQGADASRLDGLEQRAGSLEKQAGAAFNPEAVASAVLPSVFRVRAGQFTGTAFAVGKAPSGGGTTLLTNFHVVESVFVAGERKVFLERKDQRFEATIIATDKDKDLAQLRTSAKFAGLVAARDPVRSGQQIIVVGAPLGLQDSVTTGVVSAFREDERGAGPVIQFDAPINPGNSGGPVINGSKEVVGIATAKARNAEGIGLAVPIKTACDRFRLC
ncbi:trypsin-like peptidase domain-containing protein [Micromonospora sp. C32]|uniref:S1C family serine protease n=1 Tax=unclassified Micromonospora TaxID=2617518 RepID=UPI001B38D891|nr:MULTISPECIES: trypsin-like peptidase domain-containing protein [unclassified Micromonospora]MBQ1045754.1 trypsin-like peptidase domain-containing protein [Micromonospora sp. C72]MBQ1056330.1 trypsin-like peptidase domain-containing protein [Micromonospora sp. C32]